MDRERLGDAVYRDEIGWEAEDSKLIVWSHLGHYLIEKLDEDILLDYKVMRLKTVGFATVNRDFESVRAMLIKARKKKLIKEVPEFDELVDKSMENRRTVTITDADEERILVAAKNFKPQPRLYALILALRDSGARPNELYPVADNETDYTVDKDTFFEPIRWRDLFDENGIVDITQVVAFKGKMRTVRLCVVTERMKIAFLDLWHYLEKSRNTLPQNGASLDNLVFPKTSFQSSWEIVRVMAGVPVNVSACESVADDDSESVPVNDSALDNDPDAIRVSIAVNAVN